MVPPCKLLKNSPSTNLSVSTSPHHVKKAKGKIIFYITCLIAIKLLSSTAAPRDLFVWRIANAREIIDTSYHLNRERSGSVVECLTSRPRGCEFEPHRRHCVVSLSKTHLS